MVINLKWRLGSIQQAHTNAASSYFTIPSHTDKSALFSTLISRTLQDIDVLIDALPSHEYTQDKQLEMLKKLEVENQHSTERLARAVEEGGGDFPLHVTTTEGLWLCQCYSQYFYSFLSLCRGITW